MVEVRAERSGYITELPAMEFGLFAMRLEQVEPSNLIKSGIMKLELCRKKIKEQSKLGNCRKIYKMKKFLKNQLQSKNVE